MYELAVNHREQITRLMEEFDVHDIDTSVHFDGYERERRQQTTELGASTDQPQANHGERQGKDVNVTDTEHGTKVEPSLFNILRDDDDDDDLV